MDLGNNLGMERQIVGKRTRNLGFCLIDHVLTLDERRIPVYIYIYIYCRFGIFFSFFILIFLRDFFIIKSEI